MPFVSLPEVELFYEMQGQGEPIVLIHGLGVDSSVYLSLIRFLKMHFQVIRFDLRGSGQTQFNGKAFNLDDLSQDILGLLDFLNIQQAHIVGHSLGGMVARHFAANFQVHVKKLVVLNSRSQKNWVTTRFWEGLAAVRQQHDLSAQEVAGLLIPLAYSNDFLAQDANIKALLKTSKFNAYPQSPANFVLQSHAATQFDPQGYIPYLTMPVLLVGGTQDFFVPLHDIQAYAKALPDATLVLQEGGAHNPLIETPEWLAEKLIEFLD